MILPLQRGSQRTRARWRWTLYLFLCSGLALTAAERPAANPAPEPAVFVCGNRTLTTNELLQGRYPDAETLNVPDACKERARQLIAKWRKDDLASIGTLFERACSAQGGSYERLILEQSVTKADRETELQSVACDCYGEALAKLTNAPAAPSGLVIAGQSGLAGHNVPDANQVAVRFSPGVSAKRAGSGITKNAEELTKTLSAKSLPAGQEATPHWIPQYKRALDGIVADTRRVEVLSMELGVDAKAPAVNDLPGLRQKLTQEIQTLSAAFEGLTRERELPRGECPEAFAIRHQVLLQFVKQLIDSQGNK